MSHTFVFLSFKKHWFKYILPLQQPPLFPFFFFLQCFLIFFYEYIYKLKRRQRAAFWKHNFASTEHHLLFSPASGHDAMSVMNTFWLTPFSHLVNILKRKHHILYLLSFLFSFFSTIQSFSEPSCFPNHSIFRLSVWRISIWWFTGKAVHISKQSLLFLILSFSILLFPVVIHFGRYFNRDFPKKRIRSNIKMHLNNIQELKWGLITNMKHDYLLLEEVKHSGGNSGWM